ncbi:MAG: hypothetical protein VXW32_04675, partial [Myxococcota bacterium]|nr:hypothetical protein [Myxococcota bacterium]
TRRRSSGSPARMPPICGRESERCENPWRFQDDPRLSTEQSALIEEWDEAGGPIGNIEDAVSLPEPRVGLLSDPDVEAFPAGLFTTSPAGEVEDEFICFTIDPGLTESQWLEAFQVIPDDLAVVHHVLVGIDHEGTSADLANPDGTYPCFGGFGELEASFIGGWIPGASPIEFPEYSAYRLNPESRVVLQMHYHLVDEERQDGTGIALRFADQPPIQEAVVALIGNAQRQFPSGDGLQPGEHDPEGKAVFRIPANESDHKETMRYHPWDDLPRESHTFLIANHMHYIGKDMRIWIERGDNAPVDDKGDACLLHTPNWDYAWQQFYKYDAANGRAPVSYPGDALYLECIFDNTLANPYTKKALEEAGLEEPIDVSLGNGTLDEMCIAVIGQVLDIPYSVDNPSHTGHTDTLLSFLGDSSVCSGPAGFEFDASGVVTGRSACGLDLDDGVLSMEFLFTGATTSETTAEGEAVVTALYLEGDEAVLDWTATRDSDVWEFRFEGSGRFTNIPVDFSGDAVLTPTD